MTTLNIFSVKKIVLVKKKVVLRLEKITISIITEYWRAELRLWKHRPLPTTSNRIRHNRQDKREEHLFCAALLSQRWKVMLDFYSGIEKMKMVLVKSPGPRRTIKVSGMSLKFRENLIYKIPLSASGKVIGSIQTKCRCLSFF